MKNKKRVLVVSEFSKLNTGFSVMSMDLLKGLHASGKYEVAELASYVAEDDPRIHTLPWPVYAAQPAGTDREGLAEYNRNYVPNQFGALKFEDAVLDFKPDTIVTWRDFWMDEFITRSPYRHMYQFIWSTCIDSEPPKIDWLNRFSTVDLVSSYTNWGLNVLKRYGGPNKINVADTNTMPGVDTKVFKPMDKDSIRTKYGIKTDVNIVMKCARNQPRKLFPDLIRSFMNSMDQLYADGKASIADRTFLFLHTSLYDVGWDLISEIKKYNASHKVLLTYHCATCKHTYLSFARGKQCHCIKCGNMSAITPNTGIGVDRQTLAELYNIADLYIQVQVAGALEIPVIEAKACGIPTMAVEYAAPYELQQMGGSFKTIKVGTYRQEGIRETSQFRAYVDCEDLTKKLCQFYRLGEDKKKQLSEDARDTAVKHHSSDSFVDKWMQLIDSLPKLDHERWFKSPEVIQLSQDNIPWKLPDIQFVRWCCNEILPKTFIQNTYLFEKELLDNLNMGFVETPQGNRKFDKQDVLKTILAEVEKYNHFELHRYNMLVTQPNKNEEQINYRVF